MSQLKDNNGQDYMPNTIANNVSYGNTNVAAKIAELEQGGSVNPVGINLFDPATVVSGRGVVYNTSGTIKDDSLYSCVFIPLEYDTFYRMSGYNFEAGGGHTNAHLVALGKGTKSSFGNLLAADLNTGCEWLTLDKVFTHGTNLWIAKAPTEMVFKTPKASEMVDDTTTIGIVINTTFNNVTPTNSTLSVVALANDGSGIKRKAVGFFGDSITAGTNGGFVDKVRVKAGLSFAVNYGSSGAASARLASIMLSDSFRETQSDLTPKPYEMFDAVVIQIGTNGGVSGNIDNDIPDISIYDIPSYSYEYSASGKTISSATINNAKEFFTKCFANTFYGNIALCIEYVRYINSNCRVFLTTIPHNIGFANFDTVRNAILNLAAKMGVQVLDAGAYAGLGVWNITDWSKDTGSSKTHFNEKGNEMWAAYLANELDKKFYETEL